MVAINRRFLTQEITGIQRATRELIEELDKIVEKNQFKISDWKSGFQL